MFKFNVTGDKLHLESYHSLNSGSYGYYTAEFKFDGDWEGIIPHITIIENGTPRVDEVIVDNTFKIQTTESGVMQIGVYGLDSNGKKCISSNFVCIEVSSGAYTGVAPLPKDIWDGYQIIVLGYMKRAEGAATDAKAAADKAEATQTHGPIIGGNGNWWLWSADEGQYVDSKVSAHGNIVVDEVLDANSNNPIANKVVGFIESNTPVPCVKILLSRPSNKNFQASNKSAS